MSEKYNEFDAWYKNASLELSIFPEKPYVKTKVERCFLTTSSVIVCLPCCLYSSFIRLILCPFTCGSSLGGTTCTLDSDKCIINCCDEINKHEKYKITQNLEWVSESNDTYVIEKVNEIFNNFKIKFQTPKIYEKYLMCDWMNLQLKSLGFKGKNLLPNAIVNSINLIQNDMNTKIHYESVNNILKTPII